MTPTVEELAYAVICLGSDDLPTDEIPHEVLDRLIEFNMVYVKVDSAPVLTEYGEKTLTAMEAGDPIPEFD